MQTIINKLIQLADNLDGLGLRKHADTLDQIIAKTAAGDDFEDYLKLFDEPVMLDSEEDKGPGTEKIVVEEPEIHTPLEEEEAPLSKEKTGPSRLDMIKRRHELMKLKKQLEKAEKSEAEELDREQAEMEVPLDNVLPIPDAEDIQQDFEDEDMDEAANEADDGGLIDALAEKLKSVPELASKLLTIVKENPELLELLV